MDGEVEHIGKEKRGKCEHQKEEEHFLREMLQNILGRLFELGIKLRVTEITLILLLFATLGHAAEISYNFKTTDVAVAGQPGKVVFAEDIDDDGTLLANALINNVNQVIIAPAKKKTSTLFGCGTDTVASSISRGKIAGACGALGFVRPRDGNFFFLDFPGTDSTQARGLNGNTVVGQIVKKLCQGANCPGALSYRDRGFKWTQDSGYQEINFPHENTFVDLVTINRHGTILGRYVEVDLENNILESGWFLDNNGQFELPFPLDFGHIGGDTTFVTDMNNDGTALLIRRVSGEVKIQLWDDGVFFDVTGMPANWVPIQVRGMNNNSQFVGSYAICDYSTHPVCEYHGFVASPAPVKVAHKKDD